jgi:hypothetical protein
MLIVDLQPYEDKTVILNLLDGEISTVKILFVDTEYDDIIVDIIHTNNSKQYTGPPDCVYTIRACDILSVDESSN